MSELPKQKVTAFTSYDFEVAHNNEKAESIIGSLFPDFKVPKSTIFEMFRSLENVNFDTRVIPAIIRGVNKINSSDGDGSVTVAIKKEIDGKKTIKVNIHEIKIESY